MAAILLREVQGLPRRWNGVARRDTIASVATVREHGGVGEVAVVVAQGVAEDGHGAEEPQQLRSSKDAPEAVAGVVPFLDAFPKPDSLL